MLHAVYQCICALFISLYTHIYILYISIYCVFYTLYAIFFDSMFAFGEVERSDINRDYEGGSTSPYIISIRKRKKKAYTSLHFDIYSYIDI